MLDQLKNKFIEEAAELVQSLERTLLELEANPEDKDLIEKVFRVMHTLKGNSSMFGYDKIGELTHHLETIYDLVRDGKQKINKALLDITLESVDHLSRLIDDQNLEIPQNVEIHQDLMLQVTDLASFANNKINESKSGLETKSKLKTFYIIFRPGEDVMRDGTNPLYLLDELHSLGACKVTAHTAGLPSIIDLDSAKCYVYWDIYLSTAHDIQAIKDVFLFIDDDKAVEIYKVADQDLFQHQEFIAKIKEIETKEVPVDIKELQNYVNRLLNIIREKTLQSELIPKKEARDISSIRVSSEKLDELLNLVSELVTTQASLSLIADHQDKPELLSIAENIEKISRRLRENTFSICLIPVENMLTRFQRLVRDLSAELKKEIIFLAEGTETELDKSIIENLTDPLMHIFRNCIGHGIEDAATREKLGKSRQGKIKLKAFYTGTNVNIQIEDDGAGIDIEKIKAKAVEKGLISPEVHLSKKEVLELIFHPGLSTATKVTEVSGRGVGMDVVKRKIADIRGQVEIDSEINEGTTITIKLPLTLSIIDGLLVRIGKTSFVVPLSVVNQCFEVNNQALAQNFNKLVVLDGELIPYFHLREDFNIDEIDKEAPEIEQIVICNYEGKKAGLIVDEVVGEYQAVLKPLGKLFRNQDMFSGASILGDGTVALVMDTNKIINELKNQFVTI